MDSFQGEGLKVPSRPQDAVAALRGVMREAIPMCQNPVFPRLAAIHSGCLGDALQ